MADLLVKNGRVVTPEYTYDASIVIDKGKVAGIVHSGPLPDAEHVIDAQGLHVLPGVIDAHVHLREPGWTHKEDFGTGTTAAAAGGVACIIDMPNTVPATTDVKTFEEKLALVQPKAMVDFGLTGIVLDFNIEEIPSLSQAGVIGWKCFMGESVGSLVGPDDGGLFHAFQLLAGTGLRIMLHAENNPIIQFLMKQLREEGRTEAEAWLDARPAICEVEAINRAALMAETAGNKIHIVHLSSKEGVEAVRYWKKRGVDITCETGAHYITLSREDYKRLGMRMKMNPPVRDKEHGLALLEGLKSGVVDIIATDHSPHTLEEKLKDVVWQAISGFCGVETSVPVFLTMVNEGKLTLNQYVRLTSENPAKVWDMWPQKGHLNIGADGDLTIVDMKKQGILHEADLHSRSKIFPYEGVKVTGMPVYTVVRGHIQMREGEVVGQPCGQLVRPIQAGKR